MARIPKSSIFTVSNVIEPNAREVSLIHKIGPPVPFSREPQIQAETFQKNSAQSGACHLACVPRKMQDQEAVFFQS